MTSSSKSWVLPQYQSQRSCYWLPRSVRYNLWPWLINATFPAGLHPGLLQSLYTRVSHTYKWPFPLGIVVNEDNLKWGWHAAQSQTLLVPNTPAAQTPLSTLQTISSNWGCIRRKKWHNYHLVLEKLQVSYSIGCSYERMMHGSACTGKYWFWWTR